MSKNPVPVSLPRIGFLALVVPFVCFFLSGASGLVFEVIWTRKLVLVFGASTPAISTVLSAFMGGLALGSFVLGRYVDRIRFPIVVYALAEAGVGLFALAIPWIVETLYPPVGRWITQHGGHSFDAYTLLRFAVVALVLLPPTTLMGATLPLLVRHFVRSETGLGHRVGALYAVNTFGAVAGTFIAGFLLLPHIGLRWTNAAAALTNVTLAALVVLFRKQLLGASWPKSWRELLPARAPVAGSTPEVEAPIDDDRGVIDEPTSPGVRAAVLFAAAGSGFAALAYEVILTRALDMVIGSSIYGFTIILMAFLVGIGGGSGVASAILRARPSLGVAAAYGAAFMGVALVQQFVYNTRLATMITVLTGIAVMLALVVAGTARRPALALGALQLLVGLAAVCTYYFQDKTPNMYVYLAMVATNSCDSTQPLAFSSHVTTIQTMSFVVAALCALPAALGMGAMFPLAVRAFARRPEHIGGDTGRVYSVNTIGSILGSFLTGFLIMPSVGMETAFYFAVSVNFGLALLVLLVSPGDEPAKYVFVPMAAILLAIAGTGTVLGRTGRAQRSEGRLAVFPRPWSLDRMTLGVFRLSLADGMITRRNHQCVENEPSEREAGLGDDNPIFYRDGVTTTVSVERWSFGNRTHYSLKNNGKVDASNGDDMPTQVLVGTLPLLLHRRGPVGLDVALVGWGSGVTVGSILQFPVRRVDVVELERATIEASRFFADVNHLEYNLPEFPYVRTPRLTVYNNDGRNYLAGTQRRYDVVVSEPSNPWITGVANMFTVDHFRAASQALAPGGLYVQWAQLYEMSPDNVKIIYRTFAHVFPYIRVFSADAYSSDTILVGSFSPIELNVDRVARFLASDARAFAALQPAHVTYAEDLFARLELSDRDEVLRFAMFEEERENGRWAARLRAVGGTVCEPGICRRRSAPLNTDDNALIEFAAPRDLIGFDAFQGYTEVFYGDSWPYGRVETVVQGMGEGASRVDAHCRLAMALLAAGRPNRAEELLDAAVLASNVSVPPVRTLALEQAASVWAVFSTAREPPLRLDELRYPAGMNERDQGTLRDAYANATRAVSEGSFRTALAALTAVPAHIRREAGPSFRALNAAVMFRTSALPGAENRFGEAAEEFERLVADEPEWTERHPEVFFYLGHSRYRVADFARAVAALSRFAELASRPQTRDHEVIEVPRDLDEPPAGSAPVTDAPGQSDKDLRSSAARAPG